MESSYIDTHTGRHCERLTINKEFESFDAFITEYVTNISRTGVFVRSKQPYPVGTRVNLHFSIILEGLETIEGEGEVVRIEHEPAGMGIAFVTLTPESQSLVSQLTAA